MPLPSSSISPRRSGTNTLNSFERKFLNQALSITFQVQGLIPGDFKLWVNWIQLGFHPRNNKKENAKCTSTTQPSPTVLVVVDLLDVEVLPRVEVHDVEVDVELQRLRQQLLEPEHLPRGSGTRCIREQRLQRLETRKSHFKFKG
jgi:hypothetical protein